MARDVVVTITKRTVAVASLHSTSNTDSNVHDGVGKSLFVDPLKGKMHSKIEVEAAISILGIRRLLQ